MQKYEQISTLSAKAFKRRTGVKKETFEVMVAVLQEAEKAQKAFGGKPNILSIHDRLLMSLEYLREYRTYFHIAHDYDISESTCYRKCRWVEETLIKSQKFRLPGKKALLKTNAQFEVILIDATESPIERPKKNAVKIAATNKSTIIQERKNAIP